MRACYLACRIPLGVLLTCRYGSQPHAVTAAFGNSYGYDAVGNQTSRIVAGSTYTQTFDYDNRLTLVTGASLSAGFVYDAEGQRVKGTVGGVTTVYIAGLYEWQNGAVTQYYEGGAIRRMGYANDNGVFYVVSDHLRSTSVLINQDGTVKDRNYYYPYGGNRGGSAFSGLTTKRFTGQYHEQGLPGGEGLSYIHIRKVLSHRSVIAPVCGGRIATGRAERPARLGWHRWASRLAHTELLRLTQAQFLRTLDISWALRPPQPVPGAEGVRVTSLP